MTTATTYDAIVIGAGVFGAWTALHLARRKQRVLLLEAQSPAHSRASSGGESRIIRMGYGPDEIYTRWSQNSLQKWKALFTACGDNLFHQTGVLWLFSQGDSKLEQSASTLLRCGVKHEIWNQASLARSYPQFNLENISRALFEPESGVLMARRAVARTVESAQGLGAQLRIAQVAQPMGAGRLDSIKTSAGESYSAANFVFACGPWLGKLFPEILSPLIFPTRQEVFFFAPPPGDMRFSPPSLPTWLFQSEGVYGMPDLEGRGLKIACDTHGEAVDPDTQSRLVSPESVDWARKFVARRFPALQGAPIVETRVCQYENTSNGDFLIDRHPEIPNVWFAGGGSGHGFKHGPALGEYVAAMVLGEGTAEPRFSLATKATQKKRTVH
jgi:sarcosine oxidase